MRSLLITALALMNRAIGAGSMDNASTALLPSTASNNQTMALANAISNQNGIIDLRSGMPIELYEKPQTSLLTARGRNAADDTDMQVQSYAFNTDAYNVTVDDANPGTAALPTAVNDGFSGKNLQRHIQFDNAGRGCKFNQLTITAKDADGNQDLTILEQMEFTMLTYTVIGGREKPVVIDIASALRNTQQQSGLLTITLEGWVNSQTQWSWVTPAGATITVQITWDKRA